MLSDLHEALNHQTVANFHSLHSNYCILEIKMDIPGDVVTEEEYIVEKILDKKYDEIDGTIKYFLKWKGYPDSENTWEPIGNLDCDELIEEFERNRNKANKGKKKRRKIIEPEPDDESDKRDEENIQPNESSAPSNSTNSSTPAASAVTNNSDRVPKEILGVTNVGGALKFLMKWDNRETATFILAKEANIMFPQLVIDYYEAHIKLCDPGTETRKRKHAP